MYQKKNGYWCMYLNGETVWVHRYVWEQHYGAIPENIEIHHINEDKSDNRIENLKALNKIDHFKLHHTKEDRKLANHKYPLRKDNSSGYKGITFNKKLNKWIAQISDNAIRIHLGCFMTAEDAARAYDKKAKELWGDEAYQNIK
jgi:hypothetical protein